MILNIKVNKSHWFRTSRFLYSNSVFISQVSEGVFTRVSRTIPPFSEIHLQSEWFEAKPVVCIKVDVRDPKRRVDDDCGLSLDLMWMAMDARRTVQNYYSWPVSTALFWILVADPSSYSKLDTEWTHHRPSKMWVSY